MTFRWPFAAIDEGDNAWRADAACRGVDPDVFYVDDSSRTEVRKAKAICEPCPVRQPCLEYALANRERWGIWGGLTEVERRVVQRRRRKSKRCTRCGATKPATEFYVSAGGRLTGSCIDCRSDAKRARREGAA